MARRLSSRSKAAALDDVAHHLACQQHIGTHGKEPVLDAIGHEGTAASQFRFIGAPSDQSQFRNSPNFIRFFSPFVEAF